MVYTKEKNVKAAMEFEVFKRRVLRPTLSIDMVQWVYDARGKISAMVEKDKGPWQRNIVIIFF